MYRGSSPRPIIKYLSNFGVNWIKIGDTKNSDNYQINDVEEKITIEGAKKSRKVNKGEIILANSMSFGKAYLLNIDGYIYDGWFVLRDYEKYFDKIFLLQLLNSDYMQRQYKKLSAGGIVQNISSDIVYNTKIICPPLTEQKKIATFLSKIDERISTQRALIEDLEKYKKGLMQKLFSREICFPNFSDEWEEKALGEIGETYNGLSGKTKEDFGEGKPYIQYKQVFDNSKIDIQNFDFVNVDENENQNKVKCGDVLFTTSSETPEEVGMSSVLLDKIDKDLYLNSFCFGYRANFEILNPFFARYLFRSENFRNEIKKLAQGSTRYNISKVQLMNFKILLPNLEEQTKIASILSKIDEKIETEQQILENYIAQKRYLLQKMFV